MNTVMTVTGPVSCRDMGKTLMHEHVTFAYPGWYADNSLEQYNQEKVKELLLPIFSDLNTYHIKTIVDATPADTGGRDPYLLKQLSEETGINIIAAAGLYTQTSGAYNYYHWQSTIGGRNLENDLYELFMHEITVGIGISNIKAGVIKVATSDPEITDYEKIVLQAAVRASNKTDVPIITHTDGATVGTAQQDFLYSLGVDSAHVMIGHQNNSTDLGYHLKELEKEKFYLGFDRTNPLMSGKVMDNIITLIKKGYTNRIMLSHDCIFHWLGRPISLPPRFKEWKPTYIDKILIPKLLEADISQQTIDEILIENPRRFFEK